MNEREVKFGSDSYHKSVELRDKILRKPLGLEFSLEFLASEKNQYHLGIFSGDKILGILLFQVLDNKVVKMRQVAVDNDFQSKGIGKKLVLFSERFAKEKGFEKIVLNARDTAVSFYKKLNYKIVSDKFIEVGIEHFVMEKDI
ncbi:MAG: GNAT family N-acetyltransferase [Bacteroidota bacterium]|nr:GNAT family N-acetyltransferase [Bacteroidota bacterium]